MVYVVLFAGKCVKREVVGKPHNFCLVEGAVYVCTVSALQHYIEYNVFTSKLNFFVTASGTSTSKLQMTSTGGSRLFSLAAHGKIARSVRSHQCSAHGVNIAQCVCSVASPMRLRHSLRRHIALSNAAR